MPELQAEREGRTIVLVGSFNAKIFHPFWFAKQGILPDEDAEVAEVVGGPDFVNFNIGWLQCLVTPTNFQATTTAPEQRDALRDFVLATFQLLMHTPIVLMGINYEGHFGTVSETRWHEIGHLLTPKTFWSEILDEPGMRSLTMEGRRTDGRRGHIHVTVEPSIRVTNGIYVRINDHYDLRPESESLAHSAPTMETSDPGATSNEAEVSDHGVVDAGAMVETLTTAWASSIEFANVAVRSVLKI